MEEKIVNVINGFKEVFRKEPSFYIDAGGRYEILGNHTDHNHGLCLVANASLRVRACVAPHPTKVQIKSKGYSFFEFNCNDLENDPNNPNRTLKLFQGVLFKLRELGYKVGGFSIYLQSEIPDGSGVSSSAAVESLCGFVINHLYNKDKIDDLTIAKVGKYSENVFFGKPCGLLDQIGTSFGNLNFIDFKNIDNPRIENIQFNLPLDIFLVKSLGNHSNLTPLSAEIPSSMHEVASCFNKEVLRDVPADGIVSKIHALDLSEKKKKKALHFFIENNNVLKGKEALVNNDLEGFLNIVRASQASSFENINNTYVENEYDGSPQYLIDEVTEFLKDKGAARIHGGGFKGTIIIFVKKEYSAEFSKFLQDKLKRFPSYKVDVSKNEYNIIDF